MVVLTNNDSYVLTMVEATTGWLETHSVSHATAQNTILGLENQVLWQHGTPECIESDNGTHFKNDLVTTWAREHGIEWVYHIPYHAPAAGKVERCNGLLKTTLKALGGGTFKSWDENLAKATWLVNTRGSVSRTDPAQAESLHIVDGDKVPAIHLRGMLGKAVWVTPASGQDKPICEIVFAQGPGHTWWEGTEDGKQLFGVPPDEWQKLLMDIAGKVKKLNVRVCHVDALYPRVEIMRNMLITDMETNLHKSRCRK
ncbi:hypothetical protein BTVI_48714 [Pitangus sulphuratus]|nr:hypothetical protein BTVI_48714 [Pitangus sulphuratus]